MRILLTGSNGFIGSYFLYKYKDKYDIKTFSFLKDNFEDLDISGIDTVIHLSALVHQMKGAEKEKYNKINISQTVKLAKKAKKNGVKHFIFMSTIKVCGEENEKTYTISSKCTPQDDYAKSKLKAEKKLLELEDENFSVSIIRPPVVYGYGVKANIKNLILLVRISPVLPFKDIKNERSMIYVGNLCHILDQMAENRIKGTFLVCDNETLSTSELILKIASAMDKKIVLVKIPFFKEALKILKPSFYKRLYGTLKIESNIKDIKLPCDIQKGIEYTIKGEK